LVLTALFQEQGISLWFTKKHRLAIPSNTEYSIPQLRMMIREIEEILDRQITADEWDHL
jgi:hypothetical protein